MLLRGLAMNAKACIMRDMQTNLLNEIEYFMSETGMSEATFCRMVDNGRLFERLRTVGKRGRPGRVWPETEAEIRAFMIAFRMRQKGVA